MAFERELIREIRALDEYDLRRLQIFIGGLLVSRTGVDPERERRRGTVTFRQERVRCGRGNCTKCPHGPYWYAYWREGGKLRSRYIGKKLPSGDARGGAARPPG